MVQVQPPPVQCYSLCGSTGWVVAGVGGSVKGSVGDSVGCMVWVGVVCTRCGSVACSVGDTFWGVLHASSLRCSLQSLQSLSPVFGSTWVGVGVWVLGSVGGSVGDSVGCTVWAEVVCTRCDSVACSVSGSVLADQYRSPSLRPKLLLQFWETALLEIKT